MAQCSYHSSPIARTKDLDTIDLLDQLPTLQQLLYRVLGCQDLVFTLVEKTSFATYLVPMSCIEVFKLCASRRRAECRAARFLGCCRVCIYCYEWP
ncbi:putative clathrin assembly protein At4g25940 [Spinacia oleracea]|uniref:Clathrin assembly protein At4g25940 n=1 Tax=Spinacia oleracea TaxID=3562 RepID=A0ABM3R458_SPIOL|nr:putative clathrin assembly protein At4g25940 [Spinacia oleracea]